MTGKHTQDGQVTLSWDSQTEKLYSPDRTQQCLPCESCGQPQWVTLSTVAIVCLPCYNNPASIANAEKGVS